jgi:hypothetical protein
LKEFTVRSGKYAGIHNIYDDAEQFVERTGLTPKKWGDISIKPDDWVIADDGFVIQCLYTATMENRFKKRTYLYRFCIGTRYTYEVNSGLRVPNFYIFIDFLPNKNSLGKVNTTYKRKDKLFGMLLKEGNSLEVAYQMAYKRKPTRTNLGKVIGRNKEAVMDALQKNIQTINERVKQETGRSPAEIMDDALVAYYSRTVEPTAMPLKELREHIKFHFQVGEFFKKQLKGADSQEDETPPLLVTNKEG